MTRLFHVSDVHFGRVDQAAIDWFAGLVHAERPDAVVMTGDLTMRARAAEYAAGQAWLASLGVPLTVEPGNHDLPLFNPVARLFTPYRRYHRIERAVEKELDLPGVWIVPLRTTTRFQLRNWSKGVVRARHLDTALARLRACPPDRLAIVAAHHPLIDTGTQSDGRTRGGEQALRELVSAGAHAVLSGHVHDPFDQPWSAGGKTIRMIGAGTLSQRTRASRPSFNELVVEDGTLRLVERTMD